MLQKISKVCICTLSAFDIVNVIQSVSKHTAVQGTARNGTFWSKLEVNQTILSDGQTCGPDPQTNV